MSEVYRYESPEAGFNERLKQAVARYFELTSDGQTLRFNPGKLFQEHPNLKGLENFNAKISNTSTILYSFNQYNRYRSKPELKVIQEKPIPNLN